MTTAYCVKCNLVMKAIDMKKALAITDTIYECPKCNYKIGIVTSNCVDSTGDKNDRL
jgi:hypothetical protein